MSFVVSFQGQFRPYDAPKTESPHKISRQIGHQLNPLDEKERERHQAKEDFHSHLKKHEKSDHKASSSGQAIQAYKKTVDTHQKFKKIIYAKDIMSSPVHLLTEDNTMNDVVNMMEKYHHRHIPIVNSENNLSGMISEKEILKSQGKYKPSDRIKLYMGQKVLAAKEMTPIQDIARIMLIEQVNALPILNDQNHIIGIVTQTNILEYVTNESLL